MLDKISKTILDTANKNVLVGKIQVIKKPIIPSNLYYKINK